MTETRSLADAVRLARAAGRRLGEYWRMQAKGEEALHELCVQKWTAEGRLGSSIFLEDPVGEFVRGVGPCRNCGLRAWKWRQEEDGEDTVLRCVGCTKPHDETGIPIGRGVAH